ncbi:acetyltransferase (GNAT) family protein [Micromonospora pisi]|uniref:Acetyltransferase (GNAT) family protein n=1 Tax=Micromonospora pisi TaxID=589240 RepID=A0A495JAT5_9ACTN|nr:GNAT family N-acetyltransferase [Micromonospora pisi]RKR86130.1 acetyltransferase (GNAT) family protein [Micromonospora pisi]
MTYVERGEVARPWRVETRPWDDPAGRDLRARQRAELDARYGTDEHEPGTPPSESDIAVFVVALDVATARPLGCGALRQLSRDSAEIKRMYVLPDARGTGVATGLLRALESAAMDRGWTTLRLETGTAQPDAQRFYQREGYHPIEAFGSYVGSDLSLCYERRLR